MVVADRLIDGRTIAPDLLSQGLPRSRDHSLTAMGSGCDVRERAQATVIYCTDEAALYTKCVVELHAADKLASKHQRLLLHSLSTKLPICNICQVYMFAEWYKPGCSVEYPLRGSGAIVDALDRGNAKIWWTDFSQESMEKIVVENG